MYTVVRRKKKMVNKQPKRISTYINGHYYRSIPIRCMRIV